MTPSPSMVAMELENELGTIAQARTDGGADLSKGFLYLAGPMSNLPKFNFPAFAEGARILREQGYNICNPAEFDHEIARAIEANEDGSHKKLSEFLGSQGIHAPSWADCLRRDIEYVGHSNCIGVVTLDGWEKSQGAQFETYVNWKFLRPQYRMEVSYAPYGVTLIEEDRWEALAAHGIERA